MYKRQTHHRANSPKTDVTMSFYFKDSFVSVAPLSSSSSSSRARLAKIKEERTFGKPVSRRLALKRLTPANRSYLISLGFKVKKNK